MVTRSEHTVPAGDLTLHAETFGDDGPPIVLVMGLGAQMLLWPDGFCERLAERGHRVVRFDNRDIGLSTRLSDAGLPDVRRNVLRALVGRPVDAPYTLSDMAADTLAVFDHFALDRPTVVGASMGGMIVQRLALLAPERVGGLASIMSAPSARYYPRFRTLLKLLKRPGPGRDAYVDHTLALFQAMGTQSLDAPTDAIRALAEALYDRGPSPEGFIRQFAAILADGDRAPLLGAIDVPRVVVHGDEDSLVPLEAGIATAKAMRAPLHVIPGMGHDLPPQRWERILDAIGTVVPGNPSDG